MAGVIAKYEDEMVCDLAETYHVYDYRKLPVETLAAFVTGLKAESRTKMAINGMRVPTNTLIMAMIYDRITQWVWMNSKDGRKGKNKPSSLAEALTSPPKEKTIEVFESGEDFDAMLKRIKEG